ncbi:MAG: hypothetical protein AAF990_10345 [Bacteroidota bacterium]
MKQVILTTYLLLLLLFSSCQKDFNQRASSEQDVRTFDFHLIDLDEIETGYSDIYSKLDYFSLEAHPDFSSLHYDYAAVDEQQIILAQLKSTTPTILVYKPTGERQAKIDLPELSGDYYSNIVFDAKERHILVGNPEQQLLQVYSLDGSFIENIELDFDFYTFAYLSKKEQFVFRTLTHENGQPHNLIQITDKNLSKLAEFHFGWEGYEIMNHQVSCSPYELFHNDQQVFFYSNQDKIIYQLADNGEKQIFLNLQSIQQGESILGDFHLQGRLLWMHRKIFNKYYTVLFDLDGRDAYIIQNAVFTEHFGEHFDFVFAKPDFVNNDHIISLVSSNMQDLMLENIGETVNGRPEKWRPNSEVVLLRYQYNLDFFESHRQHDLTKLFPQNKVKPQNSLTANFLSAHPNPAKTTVSYELSLEAVQGKQAYVIRLYSLFGLVKEIKTSESDLPVVRGTFDLSNVPGGTYVIGAFNENNGRLIDQLVLKKLL